MFINRLILLVMVSLLCPLPLDATAAASPEEIALKLQRTYEKTSSFQAEFTQATSLQQSRRQREGGP